MNMKDSADEYATKNRRRVCFNRFLFVVNRRHITHARSPDQNRFYSRAGRTFEQRVLWRSSELRDVLYCRIVPALPLSVSCRHEIKRNQPLSGFPYCHHTYVHYATPLKQAKNLSSDTCLSLFIASLFEKLAAIVSQICRKSLKHCCLLPKLGRLFYDSFV